MGAPARQGAAALEEGMLRGCGLGRAALAQRRVQGALRRHGLLQAARGVAAALGLNWVGLDAGIAAGV